MEKNVLAGSQARTLSLNCKIFEKKSLNTFPTLPLTLDCYFSHQLPGCIFHIFTSKPLSMICLTPGIHVPLSSLLLFKSWPALKTKVIFMSYIHPPLPLWPTVACTSLEIIIIPSINHATSQEISVFMTEQNGLNVLPSSDTYTQFPYRLVVSPAPASLPSNRILSSCTGRARKANELTSTGVIPNQRRWELVHQYPCFFTVGEKILRQAPTQFPRRCKIGLCPSYLGR